MTVIWQLFLFKTTQNTLFLSSIYPTSMGDVPIAIKPQFYFSYSVLLELSTGVEPKILSCGPLP